LVEFQPSSIANPSQPAIMTYSGSQQSTPQLPVIC